MKLKSIRKMALVTRSSTLEVRVAKKEGLVSSAVEVASTGSDDQSFRDSQLTPGPVSVALDPANSYGLLWTVAFARKGSASLTASVRSSDGGAQVLRSQAEGKAGQIVNRMIFIP